MNLQENQLFARTSILGTLPTASVRAPHGIGERRGVPSFLVTRDQAFASWWLSFKTLFKPARLGRYTTQVRLFRNIPVARFRFAGRPVVLSVLAHIAAFLWYPYLPTWNFSRPAPVEAASAEPGKIYYRLNLADFVEKLPKITVAGSGGRPGSGLPAKPLATLGSTAQHPKITIVLRPPRPDNRRQTIHQSQSAPDLRIAMELNLPNLIAGAAAPARPQIHFTPSSSKPIQTKKSILMQPAPELAAGKSSSVVPVSQLAVAPPNLPVAPPAPAAANQGNEAVILANGALLSGKDANALVVISVDPQPGSASLALPAGNRWAEISVSPAGGGAGSPGGVHGGAANSGAGGSGTGGDNSLGVGRGNSGGGGETSNSAGILTINGGGEAGKGSSSVPEPILPANLVYAVTSFARPRTGALVVSAGPMGGGAVDAYGAMHCGKIYSVFLPMPGKSWTLQFCESKREASAEPQRANSSVIRLEAGLLPPEAELKFDFRRLPLPPESSHKVILLKGLILEDGTVDQVLVYRSVQPQMDEAARLAFLRWKFKPATREGHPVRVEVLVGIPTDAPVAVRSASTRSQTQ